MHQPGWGHETADKAEVDPDGFRLALNLQREPFQRSATVPRDPLPTAMQKCLEGHDTLESAGAMPGLGVDLIDQRRPLNCSASVCSPPDARKNPTATQERDEVHETDVNSVWRDTAPHAPAATAAAASIADAAVRVPQRIGVISSLSSSASVGRRAGEYTRPRAFAPEHHRDRPGPVAVRQAMDLLGSILEHALVSGRISENPARHVKKARLPRRDEVQALSPAAVEAMRAALSVRDATLLSVLAYAGLRPGEALGVRWGDIRERTMLIQRSISLGEEADTKTRRHRTVRLLAPFAADLRCWRMAAGRPDDGQLVFPDKDGQPWRQAAYQSWRPAHIPSCSAGSWARTRATVRLEA